MTSQASPARPQPGPRDVDRPTATDRPGRPEIEAALGLWRPGATKDAIVAFLAGVVARDVPIPERIAAFDNDGTLACEKPHTVLEEFLAHRRAQSTGGGAGGLTGLAGVARSLNPFSGGPEDDLAALMAGTTVQEYEAAVREFLAERRHPTYDRPFPDLVYAPMLQLVDVLLDLRFAVYLVSGGSRDLLRVMSQAPYPLPRDHIVGTEVQIEYTDGKLVRGHDLIPIDKGAGKPAHLWDRSGGLPLLAAGNTEADVDLLDTAQFALLVRHDDEAREFAYADEKAEEAAGQRGWTVASMRADFAEVFPG